MDIAGIPTYDGTTAQTPAEAVKTLGKDDFLKLFITQLQAQDPLKPMDGTEFTAQMAQFSSLEQLSNMSSGIDKLLLFQGSLQNTLTTGLIGKQVKVAGQEGFHDVTGVRFDNGTTRIVLADGGTVTIGDIVEVQGGN